MEKGSKAIVSKIRKRGEEAVAIFQEEITEDCTTVRRMMLEKLRWVSRDVL